MIDGFLDQLQQKVNLSNPVLKKNSDIGGGSFEKDLADSSEAILAASVLVGLKAEVLESDTFPQEPFIEDDLLDYGDQAWLDPRLDFPRYPERHLFRRPVAPPPLRRSVSLGELIEQLECIAETIESDELRSLNRRRDKRFSQRQIIQQVSSLAHREKLPETTAALGIFLSGWEEALDWIDFDELVNSWKEVAANDLDTDRIGVFWALLFLCSQGKIDLEQEKFLYGKLRLKRILSPGSITQLPLKSVKVPDGSPAAA